MSGFRSCFGYILIALMIPLGGWSLTSSQKKFIDQLSTQDHFSRQQLTHWLEQAPKRKRVIHLIKHQAEQKDWPTYRALFMTKERMHAGAQYFRLHRRDLLRAQKKYAVDPYIIAALIGVESNYGHAKMPFSALHTLNTLAFFSHHRQTLFRHELRSLLLLARDLKSDPTTIRSSYAGALGIPQFMPSTYRQYGVSAGTRPANLFKSNSDSILSIAHFLKRHGWDNKLNRDDPRNIKILLHYNHSTRYARVVVALADAIKAHTT